MGAQFSRRSQRAAPHESIYQNLNPRVLINTNSHKVLPPNTVSNHSPLLLDVYVHRSSVAVEQDPDRHTLYSLDFTFDAKCPCTVTVYFFAQEVLDAGQVTQEYFLFSYYCDQSRNLPPQSFTFEAGLAQKFPHKAVTIDIEGVTESMLLHKDRKTYVFIIEIVQFT